METNTNSHADKAAIDKAALEQHLVEKQALVDALKKYAQCRHGCLSCNCTLEARAALYPYIVRESFLGRQKES